MASCPLSCEHVPYLLVLSSLSSSSSCLASSWEGFFMFLVSYLLCLSYFLLCVLSLCGSYIHAPMCEGLAVVMEVIL